MKSKGKKAVSSTVFHPGLMHKLSVKITDQNDVNEELVNFRSTPHIMRWKCSTVPGFLTWSSSHSQLAGS